MWSYCSRSSATFQRRARGIAAGGPRRAVRRSSPPRCRRPGTATPGRTRSPRCSRACSSVTSTRAPLAPIGWPSAIAPPWTFTFASSSSSPCRSRASAPRTPRSSRTGRCRRASARPSPATCRTAPTGARKMSFGRDPAGGVGDDPGQRLRAELAAACARGRRPRAAAPSLSVEALPAVTVPSGWNAGRSFARPSAVVSGADALVAA